MAAAKRSALLAYCRSLPLATEDIKWGADRIFSLGGKMFAGFGASDKEATFGCKVPEEDFEALTRIEGIRPAPYAARFFWIHVDDPKLLPEKEAKALILGSYELVKEKLPKKLRKEIEEKSVRTKPKPKSHAKS
jgi:predicted DNA-binding protein (MmcQ/YjbR family)